MWEFTTKRGKCLLAFWIFTVAKTARTIALRLLSCAHCGKSFAVPRRDGRKPLTCSDACRKARGTHGDMRVRPDASTRTGVLDIGDWSARHGGVSEAHATLAEAFGGVDAGEWDGWHVSAGEYPLYDERGRYVRDGSGRVVPRWRNWSAEAVDVPAVDSRVIGQVDLPWDWERRLDAGESLDSLRMPVWQGLPTDVLASAPDLV